MEDFESKARELIQTMKVFLLELWSFIDKAERKLLIFMGPGVLAAEKARITDRSEQIQHLFREVEDLAKLGDHGDDVLWQEAKEGLADLEPGIIKTLELKESGQLGPFGPGTRRGPKSPLDERGDKT